MHDYDKLIKRPPWSTKIKECKIIKLKCVGYVEH